MGEALSLFERELVIAHAKVPGVFRCTVFGHPEPAGSKRSFPIRKAGLYTGRNAVTDANPKAATWKQEVSAVARKTMGEELLFGGPLQLMCTFYLLRPRGHYGSGRNAAFVRNSAPEFPMVRPDCTKLLRAVEDALIGVVYGDDAQIVEQNVAKRYGEPERVEVVVRVCP